MQVGIIGGGQLAMMLCEAAKELNIKTVVLEPNLECSAKCVCDDFILSNYDDEKHLEKLASSCDVVTYEFENVDTTTLEKINNKFSNVIQTAKPLLLSNDRLTEKQKATEAGFNPVAYTKVDNVSDVKQFTKDVGYPVVIKTRRFGYDGKGQMIIDNESQLNLAAEIIEQGAICEQMIELDYETSVIAIRNKLGQCQFIPSTKNTHKNNILFKTEIDKEDIDKRIIEKVEQYISYHDLVGILSIEVFVAKDGTIYFNELAPRPHNSGHYSIEGCNHSQYEMHLRAICNLELPKVELVDKSVMINVLGQDYQRAKEFIASNKDPNIYFHDYHKKEVRKNRKMAHITAVGNSAIEKLNIYENQNLGE